MSNEYVKRLSISCILLKEEPETKNRFHCIWFQGKFAANEGLHLTFGLLFVSGKCISHTKANGKQIRRGELACKSVISERHLCIYSLLWPHVSHILICNRSYVTNLDICWAECILTDSTAMMPIGIGIEKKNVCELIINIKNALHDHWSATLMYIHAILYL